MPTCDTARKLSNSGAVPGVLIGARLATSVQERVLRRALAGVLMGIGLPLAVFGV